MCPQIFDKLEADIEAIDGDALVGSAHLPSTKGRHLERKRTSEVMIKEFVEERTSKRKRITKICEDIQPFATNSQTLMPTSWAVARIPVKGMDALVLTDERTKADVDQLCSEQKLAQPSDILLTNSFHYGKRDESGKLVTYLCLSVMNLNNTPGSIAVCVNIAASTDPSHSMSAAIDSIKKLMRKRRNTCCMFAQVARTKAARTFWAGKLTKTRRASVLTALHASFDDRYQIYEDTEDMAIFFE